MNNKMTIDRSSLGAPDRARLLQSVNELADIARRQTLTWFRAPMLSAQNKSDAGFDPVTAADRAAEQAMRQYLADHHPQDGVLGEEFAPSPGQSGLTWVLDPIDGTRGFLSGTPCWGVLIAVTDANGPFLGVIDQPYIGERFLGGLGQASLDGPQGQMALATRETDALSQAILFTTFPEIGSGEERAAFARVSAEVMLTRYGMDCYAYALLAAGQIDLVIEAGLKPYDIAAPRAVIEAAGGIVTDWQGRPVGANGQVLAAANARLHAQALRLLAAG